MAKKMNDVQVVQPDHIKPYVLRLEGVKIVTGFSRTKIYAMENPQDKGYDPTWPTSETIEGGGDRKSNIKVWPYNPVIRYLDKEIEKSRERKRLK